jgi:HEAT repeat protein
LTEYPLPADIIRLIEEHGRDGRDILFETQLPEKIARLCGALRMAGSAHVRRVLCNLLASLTDAEALPCLLDALDDPDTSVISAAADAIGNCGYEQSISEDLRDRLGVKLVSLATGSSNSPGVRTGAIYALGLLRYQPALPFLLKSLESELPLERSASAEALAHLGDRKAVPALRVRRYRESDERVKRYISLALEELAESDRRDEE